ncbi:MAG: rhodanese-like domain-containing protein [Elusimicrobia bacterium]|nr:rhodanese-like domain-containing protein [Elusimicrobiota bacterium]
MTTATAKTTKFRVMGREELKAKIDRKEKFHLWNVLSPEYYKPEANIPGSRWVQVSEVPAKVRELGLKKTDEIVTYCGCLECPSSAQAAEKLVSMGFTKVSAYEGGIKDWGEAGLPFVKL